MFFQINVTPKEKKAAKKCPGNEEEESKHEELYNLVLAPFQPQTRVKLDTTVYNTVQCRLNVKNPSNRNLQVMVTKSPPKERSVVLTAMEFLVEAEGSADLGISWTPQEAGSWRDTLQLTDSRRVKYDVALMTTACSEKKAGTKTRTRVLAPSNINRGDATKPRRISPPLREPKKSAAPLNPTNVPTKRPRLTTQPNNDKENLRKSGWTYETSNCKQSNTQFQSSSVLDFSAIINSTNFNMTPVKCEVLRKAEKSEDRVNKIPEIKFSPQGCQILSPEIAEPPALRRETYVATKLRKVLTIHEERVKEEEEEVYEEEENFADSLSPQPDDQPHFETVQLSSPNLQTNPSDFSVLINNMNFLTPKNPNALSDSINFSPNGCSTGNRTKSSTGHPSPNGGSSFVFEGNNTFNVSSSNLANNSSANRTYELSPSPTRSKDTIKPTRLSMSFGIASSSMNNTGAVPLPSSTPCFDRLCVQNEYEMSRTSICHSSRMSIYDDASVKDVLEADLWVKSDFQQSSFSVSSLKGRCSSLEKIQEERTSTNSTRFQSGFLRTKMLPSMREEKSCKGRRLEISPPTKLSSISRGAPIRRVSPTKSSKIRKDKNILEPAASLRKKVQMNCSIKRGQVSIPGVRIANLSLAGFKRNTSLKEKASVPKTECKEVSVKLHDPNDFVTRFCNPDPFGATMTQDPFLTSTLYYDEKWMYHQEMEFKKWLNALLTPPENLNADVDTIRVDVGKVWQSCRLKEDVSLAETKEVVSARYHTNTRLNTLRKAACAMFRREEVVNPLSKATVCVERGTLMIRQDRDLHRDIGLQKEILELFLSYNPLWLRIGLETIYGETIPLHSNNDLVGLTRFLITRFFSDPFIVKTHSHANSSSVKLPSFATHMNKFILKKFLLLVFFLDHAKNNKLIGHDPCLFHKRATHKDSRSILLTFSREVLSGVGDVTKVLRSHGYVVSHKQTYLDEYDYAVKDISTDLRDGVRLCRTMELITGDRNLTCRCRVPAISRLQKVHNVDVALTALLRCHTLTGDIDAKSIADGHREKTLSLLWQIIYKYQRPRFEKAATSVQKWWRAMLWYVRVKHFLRTRKNNAAATIQRSWRCLRARRELTRLREERRRLWAEREEAVRVIQIHWIERGRMLRERNRYLLIRESTVRIQRWYRLKRATIPFVDDFRRKRMAAMAVQRHWRALVVARRDRRRYREVLEASVRLQRWWRAVRKGREVCTWYQSLREAAVLVQLKWRALLAMREARDEFQLQLRSARIVQSWWRRALTLKRDRNSFVLMKHSVLTIEGWWIGRRLVEVERRRYERVRSCVMTIQRAWRRYARTKDDARRWKECKQSCRTVQRWWRTARIAKAYRIQRRSCVLIQRWWRGVLLTRSLTTSYSSTRKAVICVQKRWRAKKLARVTRESYLAKREAATRIQASWRMVRERRRYEELLRRNRAACVVQTRWRAILKAREVRRNYLHYRQSCIVLQTRYRALRIAREVRVDYQRKQRVAVIIQKNWRMFRARKTYRKYKHAALVLQKRWRETLNAREVRRRYLHYRQACIVLQTRYRALRTAREVRMDYQRKRRATVVIQKNWRMFRALKTYRRQKHAALVLQKRWRETLNAREVRRRYLHYRHACIVLQTRYRALRTAREVRMAYQRKRRATIVIQKNWRMFAALKTYRKHKHAACVLQSRWRARKLCIENRQTFLKLKTSTLCIQRHYRAKKIGSQTRREYLDLGRATRNLQARWRANLSMRVEKKRFEECRRATVVLQSCWRMVRERKRYRLIRHSILIVQSKWRAVVLARKVRDEYVALGASVRVIQTRFRANRACRMAREEYLRVRERIVWVQTAWREKLEKRRREEAALIIQSWWMSILAMRLERQRYQSLKNAAVVIQRRYRAYKIGVQSQREYTRVMSLIIRIQRRWKLLVEEKRHQEWLRECKRATLLIEKWWIRITEIRRVREAQLAQLKKEHAAATRIQTLWRGLRVRMRACNTMKELRKRANIASQAAVPTATVAYQMQESMDMLLGCETIGQLSMCLTTLDTLTRLSLKGCVAFCERNLVDKVYGTINKYNRSLPWMDVCLRCTSILITLTKLPETRNYVYRVEYIEMLARLMTITAERHANLFLHLATLLWLLAENPNYAEAITSCPRSTWLLSSLHTSINKKKSASGKLSASNLNKSRCREQVAQLPNTKPDWGLKQKRPRLFTTVHHAITTLIKRLKIDGAT